MERQTAILVAVQLAVVMSIAAALLMYLLRFRRNRIDIGRKSVLVANCDTVTGLACALRLHQLGFRVFAACSDTESAVAKELKAEKSGRMHVLHIDTKNGEVMLNAVDYVEQHIMPDEKGLWAIVNTPCTCVSGLFEWLTWSQCEEQVSENLLATLRITKSFIHLLRSCQGRFINVLSFGGQTNYPGFSVYAATKAAIEAFTTSLQMELSPHLVRTVTVTPTANYDTYALSLSSPELAEDMWRTMTPDSKRTYMNEFRAFCQRMKSPALKSNTKVLAALVADVEEAILCRSPAESYISGPLSAKMHLAALNLLPNEWKKQRLIKNFHRNFLSEKIV
uniref:Uncharacterized protein n=1 Tax=Strigamia maritima TaxID=126957 RepID=T1JGE0_STRMM